MSNTLLDTRNNSKQNRQKFVPSISLHSNNGEQEGQELKYIVYQILKSAIEKLKLGRKTWKIWAMGFSNSNAMIREALMEKVTDILHVKEKETSNTIFCFQIQCSFHRAFTDLGSISINFSFHFSSFLLSLLSPSLPPFNLFSNTF